MKICYIEPYYSGSHKSWIDSYKKFSIHDIEIVSLPGNKWKWRMHGGAVTLAKNLNESNKNFDVIICSDFINLPVFKSLLITKYSKLPFLIYFHENQITYPWSPKDSDKDLNRDLHYHYINYTSALLADCNYFNSKYHYKSFIDGIEKYLKKMPDYNNLTTIDVIKRKSKILNIGCNLKKFDEHKILRDNKVPNILWNHRWEYDKNPNDFFEVIIKLYENKYNFNLIVIGERFSNYPKIFDNAKKILNDRILKFAYADSFEEYANWLWRSDILPVTSKQDFFGISIIEAAYCNTHPILPKRLTYPEIFKNNAKTEFYEDNNELYEKIKSLITSKSYKQDYKNTFLNKYDWDNIVNKYDEEFLDFL